MHSYLYYIHIQNINIFNTVYFKISFSKIHNYFSVDSNLVHVQDSVLDLGFKFNTILDSKPQIEMICCKALNALGFIMRIASVFNLKLVIKTLFCALVRPILEYSSIVWCPFTATIAYLIERVQRRFLRFDVFFIWLTIAHLFLNFLI